MTKRLGIAEWYGEPFMDMTPDRRRELAKAALEHTPAPPCPFQNDNSLCSKRGGVCSQRDYQLRSEGDEADRMGEPTGPVIVMCPKRFNQNYEVHKWLGRIAGFKDIYVAPEVPFMKSPDTGRAAGRIDLVLSGDDAASEWYGLETQAVYFSGSGMPKYFESLLSDDEDLPPASTVTRRPDWRSSSAKRLMPQLMVKIPTLRQWGKKLAVAVDVPFFEAIGGKTPQPSQDLNEGDIIWLVIEVSDDFRLQRHHWEVLPLDVSAKKLLAADRVRREEFEDALRRKLRLLS